LVSTAGATSESSAVGRRSDGKSRIVDRAPDPNHGMNYPAVSCGTSSSVLARHSVLDTESSRALWIPASAGMTSSRQAAGNEPPVDSRGWRKWSRIRVRILFSRQV
jgi:hypothetical protein